MRSLIYLSLCPRRYPASPSRPSIRPTAGSDSYLKPLGIHAAFSPLGIVIAITFIGLPFIVRTVQPSIEDLDPATE